VRPTVPARADPGIGVYIHWPFCASKCPYCDFNSHLAGEADTEPFAEALLRELDWAAERTGRRRVNSIFFGGGTPSLLPSRFVARLIERIALRFTLEPSAEITLEANPTSAEAGRFAGYRAAGVNRLSLGVQALDDRALSFLGRRHGVAEALAAVSLAARLFPRFSFDLIYGRPGQEVADWRAELTRALSFAGDHLSLYQLSIEPGTRFFAERARGRFTLPPEVMLAKLFTATREILARAGLPAYEVSNHARPGSECRHNLAIWRGGEYLGFGPGAHGRLVHDGQWQAIERIRSPRAWRAAVARDGQGTERVTVLEPAQRVEEMLLLGLRLAEGVSRRRFRRAGCGDFETALDARRIERLVGGGFLCLDDAGLRATEAGIERLDAVLGALLTAAPADAN
jgi:oxygen-independent coproporphyrinogen-3 oxidase